MPSTRTLPTLLLGLVLGLALLGTWLVGWRLLINAAGWFAPTMALAGVALWLLSLTPRLARLPTLRAALRTAGWGAIALAILASLSVGAFLPAGVAEWASPVLGRFGGGVALLIVSVGVSVALISGIALRRALLLDAAAALALSALWVGSQVARQATFPPPPTTAALLASRFDLLLVVALLFALLAGVSWGFEGQVLKRTPVSGSSPSAKAPSRLLSTFGMRWALLIAALGLLGSVLLGSEGWYRFALLGLVLIIGALSALVLERRGEKARPLAHTGMAGLRRAGWLVAVLLLSGVLYFATSEDLEIVLLRNNVEWGVMQFWRGVAGDRRFEAKPTGTLSGTVRNTQGEPLEGAAVVVSDAGGQVYSARTGADGSYRIEGVPADNYLPVSVAPGYRQAAPTGFAGRVVTVGAGRDAGDVAFVLQPNPPLEIASQTELSFGPPEEVSVENPKPSTARRRTFTFRNDGMLLEGGLVHEPLEDMGPGPFPILLIVYPGEASAWEGVSVPLATNGYVVVSYFPRRLLDLEGDVDDLRVLTGLVASGRLSERGDTGRMVLVGGSVSTVYTYLMAREIEGSATEEQVKAAIQYGGLFDMFRYRHDWEQGKIEIDPGISDLEYLLVAFGRPDSRPEVYLRFSPRYALGPDSMPPTLLVHAGNDIIVPAEQSRITDEELTRLGTPHEYLLYPNIEHYLDTSKRDPAQVDMLNKTLAFLQEHVK